MLSLVMFCSISSCSNSSQTPKKRVLKHVVALKFKDDITAGRKAQAIQNFWDLKDEIPEIKEFEGGKDFSVEGLDKGFTHCFILTFESEAARDIYLPHPAHIRVAEQNKPMLSDLLVLDIWGVQ